MTKQSRKFLVTMNNPTEKNFDVDKILKQAESLKGLIYACASLEVGSKEHTPHIHLFSYYENPKAWKTIVNLFDGKADVECCRGSCRQNRDYVFKLGKWILTEKGTTPIEGQQRECGTFKEERECSDPELELLYNLIKQGYSDYEIIDEYPQFMLSLSHIQRCRLTIKQEEFKITYRTLEIVYIFGQTRAGKSRYVMEKYGYDSVFRVTDYVHPYDTYSGEDVILYEEFSSSLRIQDMNNYLDGYPLKLPARYSDKVACYTKVYITTNTPLENQYPNIKQDNPETWLAFMKRFTRVIWYRSATDIVTYNSAAEYFNRNEDFHKLTVGEQLELPFQDKTKSPPGI